MEASALTHPGRVRPYNNDGYGAFPELGLFVVVDGMGGRWSRDEGAALVIATLRDAYASGERSGSGLALAIQAANRRDPVDAEAHFLDANKPVRRPRTTRVLLQHLLVGRWPVRAHCANPAISSRFTLPHGRATGLGTNSN
jgi:hypothetical protein